MPAQDFALVFLAAALALLALGAALALTSGNAAKRAVGMVIAQSGATLGAIALGLPAAGATAMLAIMLASLLIGAAIVVRLQEAYGSVEAPEIDEADRYSEPADDLT